MESIITSVQAATADWLTEQLRRAGALPRGRVINVQLRGNDALNASIAHLTASYSDDAPTVSPTRLLIKLNANHDGEGEVAFYRYHMRLAEYPDFLVRCFVAEYSPDDGTSCCVLNDISETCHEPH